LWYSVPFVGLYSKKYEEFKDCFLDKSGNEKDFWALDPRYKKVRQYLCDIYENAVKEWKLDGLKLDFIDSFKIYPDTPAFDERWDTRSVEEAVDRLLRETTDALRAINPDIMIEFRQSYFGPTIRKYGNMIRVADCPNDSFMNHAVGADLRFLLGKTPVHSDMLMWHNEDTVESAAHQVICTLFTVPQISVLLDRIPESHRRMLENYLSFWRAHRDTLIGGTLYAEGTDAHYSMVRAERERELIAIAYLPVPLTVKKGYDHVVLINGSSANTLAVRFEKGTARMRWRILDCEGVLVEEGVVMGDGIDDYDVPESGRLEFELL
jgi:alpha-galactosidase